MKRLIFLLVAFLAFVAVPAFADQYVRGYTRSDGTYVQGHYRSEPNQYRYDNYSARGNSNPYTGQTGYQRHEYTNPPAYNSGFNSGYSSDPYGRR